jgi:hypothetical protein
VEGQQEEPPDEELQQFRGLSGKDDLIHAMISWSTLESYPPRIGISLPVQNPANQECHEVQLWEETEEQWIIEEGHTNFVYSWLSNRFAARSTTRMLPVGMPVSVKNVIVQTKRDGSFGYILFTPEYSFAEPMKKMDLQVEIEYEDGFMIVGMGEAYTIRMLTNEFWELTQQTWEFAPIGVTRRENDGTVVHGVSWDRLEQRKIMSAEEKVVPPPKILEERGRGTVIKNQKSQGKLLKYWAWAQTPIEVGVYFPEESITIEYWMSITLPRVENEEDPTIYLLALKELWMIRLREISNGVVQWLESLGNDFGVQMRYLYNSLRVWFVPLASFQAGVKRPLAEEPIPKANGTSHPI